MRKRGTLVKKGGYDSDGKGATLVREKGVALVTRDWLTLVRNRRSE